MTVEREHFGSIPEYVLYDDYTLVSSPAQGLGISYDSMPDTINWRPEI
jgi:hypothetical protein